MRKNTIVNEIFQYVKEQYEAEPEYLWANSPNTAVFRHQADHKWFGIIFRDMSREKLGLSGEGLVDILDLKCDPGRFSL